MTRTCECKAQVTWMKYLRTTNLSTPQKRANNLEYKLQAGRCTLDSKTKCELQLAKELLVRTSSALQAPRWSRDYENGAEDEELRNGPITVPIPELVNIERTGTSSTKWWWWYDQIVVQESRGAENLRVTLVRKIFGKELQSPVTVLESDDRPVSVNGKPAMDKTTFTSYFLLFDEFVGRQIRMEKNIADLYYCSLWEIYEMKLSGLRE